MARRSNSPLSAPLFALLLFSSFVQLSLAVTCDSDQNMWYCASGDECVSGDQLCDGTADCGDESDELPWECGGFEDGCTDGMMPCPLTSIADAPWCFDPATACDGNQDCPYGADEWPGFCLDLKSSFDCPLSPKQVLCPGKQACVSGMVCDGVANCAAVAAEGGGTVVPDEDKDYCSVYGCPEGYWKCSNEVQCIDETLKCNGKADCKDGSDEKGCSVSSGSGGSGSTTPPLGVTTPPPAVTNPPPVVTTPPKDATGGGATGGTSDGTSGDETSGDGSGDETGDETSGDGGEEGTGDGTGGDETEGGGGAADGTGGDETDTSGTADEVEGGNTVGAGEGGQGGTGGGAGGGGAGGKGQGKGSDKAPPSQDHPKKILPVIPPVPGSVGKALGDASSTVSNAAQGAVKKIGEVTAGMKKLITERNAKKPKQPGSGSGGNAGTGAGGAAGDSKGGNAGGAGTDPAHTTPESSSTPKTPSATGGTGGSSSSGTVKAPLVGGLVGEVVSKAGKQLDALRNVVNAASKEGVGLGRKGKSGGGGSARGGVMKPVTGVKGAIQGAAQVKKLQQKVAAGSGAASGVVLSGKGKMNTQNKKKGKKKDVKKGGQKQKAKNHQRSRKG
ncbi:unnamed protein product [Closterium sp. NIES-53]